MISGIINVLKPAGMTSNYVISRLKRVLKPQKIGHLGTLDPSGTGVLPVCVNKATKLFDYYLQKDKIYRAVFVFGKETDTLDSDGNITKQENVDIKQEDLERVLPKFIGKLEQYPPKYSAKNINGKKAYDLARQGVDFELKSKQIEIYSINILNKIKKNTYLLEIHCSSGTYIRSIARDIAKELNTIAYMGAIIRTKSGNFDINDAIKLEEIKEDNIIPLKNILESWEKIFISNQFYDKIINGCSIKLNMEDGKNLVVYCGDELIGIGDIENGHLKIKTNLQEKND